MALGSHLTEQAWAKLESAYNDSTIVSGLAATDAFLHRQLRCGPGRWNRVPNPGRRTTPDVASVLDRRMSAEWSLSTGWEPSGTLGTASDLGDILTALMGTKVAAGAGAGVNTTIASGASATGAVLTSGTGLAVGDIVVVTMPAGHREATRLKTVVTNTVTWDALSTTPSVAAAVVAGVTYKLGTQSTVQSLAIAKKDTANTTYEGVGGAVVNEGQCVFDGNEEAQWSFSGPAARYYVSGLTLPGSQTLAGAPLSGIAAGNVYLDATPFTVLRAALRVQNNWGLRLGELGAVYATGAFRSGKRSVGIDLTYFFDATTLRDLAMAKTASTVRALIGSTNGRMLAIVAPQVEWEIEDVPAGDSGPKNASASGLCVAPSGNDEVFVAEI